MIILTLFPYQLDLFPELKLASGTLQRRNGWLVRLQDEHSEGWGEIAPLPGFSQERAQDIPERLAQWLENPQQVELPPSASFGLSAAVNELLQAELTAPADIQCCPLLLKDQLLVDKPFDPQLLQHWTELGEVKLKVGNDPSEDRQKLLQLLQYFPGKVRLDANQQWTFEQALQFAKDLPLQRISFIEEPLQNFSDTERMYAQLQAFYQKTAMHFALDETVQQSGFKLQMLQGLRTLVIKPTLVGSISRCCSLAEQALQQQLQVIFSSSFESSLAVGQIAAMAQHLVPHELAGLDTLRRFDCDLLRPWPGSKKRLIDLAELTETTEQHSFLLEPELLDLL
ncbi:o-succinylbenzoate synthase [Pelagibaculum spongiae]|uniref:o-succinylbenzoate synthase n=1 Tax=Pelagibaculum spongiae TaxID=2080658 RepID=A0A2V1GV25_9GAMM|nr:o-succinylbenzoate synthase [Pelagibaculum spongiae]PVZ68191.1 o-succinylbenzoate synthase [Pelagibaculum spongiae]